MREWQAALSGSRLHHAWLLTGPRGLGKMSFAMSAARELIGASDDAHDHPDLHILTHLPKDDKEEKKRADGKVYERKRNISIAQIRAMQRRLVTRPTLGERRAIIINPADDMERNASNALLKSLEEPPQGSYFFLVAHQPAKLLPTIRSRCRPLRFPPLDDAQMREVIGKGSPPSDHPEQEAAIRVAGGSPGMALRFMEMDLGKAALTMESLVSRGDPSFAERTALVAAVGPRPDRERLNAILDIARSLLADRMSDTDRSHFAKLHAAHADCVKLSGEVATYNYDPGLIVMEIGTLLANAAPLSDRVHG